MNRDTIRTILRTRLATVSGLPAVKYEDGPTFTAPAALWIQESIRAGTVTTRANGTNEARPLYLLDLHIPPTTTGATIDTLDRALENAFQAGRTLTDGGQTHQLEITSYSPGARITQPNGWGYRRITVGMTALAFRTALTA